MHGNVRINNFYIWQEETIKLSKSIWFMDSKGKFRLNLKISVFIKHFLNCSVVYLWLMCSTKKLWSATVVYQAQMESLLRIFKIFKGLSKFLKEVSCVIYFGLILFMGMEENQAKEVFQWDSDKIFPINS